MAGILKVGLIGAGRIGKVHAATLANRVPCARIAAVADVNLAAAKQVAEQYNVPNVHDDAMAVIENKDVDAVFICSATDTHARLTTAAAQAGKHIFCEKPIALNLAEIDSTLAAVKQAGVKLQVGFNRRFDPNFARVRQAIVNGEIGTPALLHIISRDPAPPPIAYVKVSGGMFLDMTIHDFDMARFLVGADVEEVYTQAGITVDPAIGEAGDVDTAVVMLKFANGVIGTIDNCRRRALRLRPAGRGAGQQGRDFDVQQLPERRDAQRRHERPPGPAPELLYGPLHRELRDGSRRVCGCRA